jgi:hypothetical protein
MLMPMMPHSARLFCCLTVIPIGGSGCTHTTPRDPVAAIRTALPTGWTVLKTENDKYPWYRPVGHGRAIYLAAGDRRGAKPEFDAVIFIMPANYKDGGDESSIQQNQTYAPDLIATTRNARIYAWPRSELWPTMAADVARALHARPIVAADAACPVTLQLIDVHPGKPPMLFYRVKMHITNPHDYPMWIVLPDSADKPIKLTNDRIGDEPGALHHLQSDRFSGEGNVVVVTDVGDFQAIHLPARAHIQFKGFQLEAWQPIESVQVLTASTLTVDGKTPVEKWLPYETMSDRIARIDYTDGKHDPQLLDFDPATSDFRRDLPKREKIFIQAKVLDIWQAPIEGAAPSP